MLLLGLDPGLQRTGWGVILSHGNALSFRAAGVVTSDPADPLAERLDALYRGLKAVVETFAPDAAAVEETVINRNAGSSLKLGQARGMAMLAPAMAGIRVAEYPPNLIKKTVVGAGHAEKRQIQAMIGFLLPKAKFESADEADALAIAICHCNHRTSPAARAVRMAREVT
ncbi:MAG: crossover junction endodeoxyribonuclease RuvC [Rhizobiales bacterium]|nr:crossover junction endodeoxyribonuclease RuvC [Hyphomicrobiales bacterium]